MLQLASRLTFFIWFWWRHLEAGRSLKFVSCRSIWVAHVKKRPNLIFPKSKRRWQNDGVRSGFGCSDRGPAATKTLITTALELLPMEEFGFKILVKFITALLLPELKDWEFASETFGEFEIQLGLKHTQLRQSEGCRDGTCCYLAKKRSALQKEYDARASDRAIWSSDTRNL